MAEWTSGVPCLRPTVTRFLAGLASHMALDIWDKSVAICPLTPPALLSFTVPPVNERT